jgi:hypothetical protein
MAAQAAAPLAGVDGCRRLRVDLARGGGHSAAAIANFFPMQQTMLSPKDFLPLGRRMKCLGAIVPKNAIDNLYQLHRLKSPARGDPMAAIETGNPRIASNPRLAMRRRAVELLVLTGTSLAFLFALAVAFGFISG